MDNYWSDNDYDNNDDEKLLKSPLIFGDITLSPATGKCVTDHQFWTSVFKPNKCNHNKALHGVKELLNTLSTSQLSSSMAEFNIYFTNGRYSVAKAAFKNDMLPRLQSIIGKNGDETKRFYALCLLVKLLFAEHESKNSQLAKVVVKSGLIVKLLQISQHIGTDSQSQKAIYTLLSYLFFVIANNHEKVIRNLLLNDSEIIINSIKREQKENYDTNADAIWLMQFFPLMAKNFETFETLLATLKTLIENQDNKVVVRECCYTLMAFARHSGDARVAIVKNKSLCKMLVDILSQNVNSVHPEVDIVTPIVSILAVLLPDHNAYRKAFIDNGLLNGVKTLLKIGCNCYRRYGCHIIKWLCMKPLANQLHKPTDIIDRILADLDVMPLLNHLMEQNIDMSLKYSALYALFMFTHHANCKQLVALTKQGTLKSLSTQLTSTDNKYLNLVLVTLTPTLISDFQEQLRNLGIVEKDKKLKLSPETVMISIDGIELLKLISKREGIECAEEVAKNKAIAKSMLTYEFKADLDAPHRAPIAVMINKRIERDVEGEFVNEYPPIHKVGLTVFSRK